MKIKNTSNKIIGIGEASVLPDSVVTVPEAFENSAVLEVYRKLGFIQIIEKARKKTAEEEAAEKTAKVENAAAVKNANSEDVYIEEVCEYAGIDKEHIYAYATGQDYDY